MSKKLLTMKLILLLSTIPLLLGNEKCQIVHKEIEMLNQKLIPPQGRNEIYLSHLTFGDPTTGSMLFQSEAGTLINDLVLRIINRGKKTFPQVKHNFPGHILQDTNMNLNKIINISFDPNLTKSEKITKIVNDIMKPNKIDILITGQYIDKGQTIDVRPLVIVAYKEKIITRLYTFSKSRLLCQDPTKRYIKAICPETEQEIVQYAKEILQAL